MTKFSEDHQIQSLPYQISMTIYGQHSQSSTVDRTQETAGTTHCHIWSGNATVDTCDCMAVHQLLTGPDAHAHISRSSQAGRHPHTDSVQQVPWVSYMATDVIWTRIFRQTAASCRILGIPTSTLRSRRSVCFDQSVPFC